MSANIHMTYLLHVSLLLHVSRLLTVQHPKNLLALHFSRKMVKHLDIIKKMVSIQFYRIKTLYYNNNK
jgi:hypothetical protein